MSLGIFIKNLYFIFIFILFFEDPTFTFWHQSHKSPPQTKLCEQNHFLFLEGLSIRSELSLHVYRHHLLYKPGSGVREKVEFSFLL